MGEKVMELIDVYLTALIAFGFGFMLRGVLEGRGG